MKSKEYQAAAISFDRSYAELGNSLDQRKLRLMHAVLGVSGESGELVDAVKKHIMYNKPLDVENVKEEIGDLCWYISLALDEIGSSFEEVMKMNIAKLSKRYPNGYSNKDAIARADKQEAT